MHPCLFARGPASCKWSVYRKEGLRRHTTVKSFYSDPGITPRRCTRTCCWNPAVSAASRSRGGSSFLKFFQVMQKKMDLISFNAVKSQCIVSCCWDCGQFLIYYNFQDLRKRSKVTQSSTQRRERPTLREGGYIYIEGKNFPALRMKTKNKQQKPPLNVS